MRLLIAVIFTIAQCVNLVPAFAIFKHISLRGFDNVEKHNHTEVQHRIKRQVASSGVSAGDMQIILNEHNKYRLMELASNMHVLRWNEDLAKAAKEWTELCVYEHGQPDLTQYGFDSNEQLGQNNYASSAFTETSFHFNQSVFLWWDEIRYYDYDTGACTDVCGHYTQVVWAKTTEVGCGLSVCPILGGTSYTNAPFVVCNYRPAGNYAGQKPYEEGASATTCLGYFENGFSSNGLCDSECTVMNSACTCYTNCGLCGIEDSATCTCTCVDGYYGNVCEKKCENIEPVPYNGNDYVCSNFQPTTTNCASTLLIEHCPAHCNLCTIGNGVCATSTTSTTTTTTTTPTTTITTSPTTTITSTTTPATTTTTPTTTTTSTTSSSSTTTNPVTMMTSTKTPETTSSPTTASTAARPASTTEITKSSETTATSNPCSGVVCHNGGTAQVVGLQCFCLCSPQFAGQFCQDGLTRSDFITIVVGVVLGAVALLFVILLAWFCFSKSYPLRNIQSVLSPHLPSQPRRRMPRMGMARRGLAGWLGKPHGPRWF